MLSILPENLGPSSLAFKEKPLPAMKHIPTAVYLISFEFIANLAAVLLYSWTSNLMNPVWWYPLKKATVSIFLLNWGYLKYAN